MQVPTSGAATAPAIINRVEAALALRGQRRLKEALDLLSAPAEFSQDVYTLRGDLQFELGQLQEAVGSYSTVLAFEGDNVYAYHHLALCLRRLGRWAAAAEAFRRLLTHDPHRDDARIGLGECLLQLKSLEEALACFDSCWSEASRRQALFGKATALQLLDRFEEAEQVYQRLLALDPKAEEAFSNLISLSIELSDFVRVHRYSLRLLELSPHSIPALQGLTLVALERHEYDTAVHYYTLLLRHLLDGQAADSPPSGRAVEYCPKPQAAERLASLRRDLLDCAGQSSDAVPR
ncbi:MAG TPA: tetratricopeptide repeat protein [Bryobacteraceae bacterium]|nr:tetratricopeptide repeat protein [Bryobacteraceae bacterium]